MKQTRPPAKPSSDTPPPEFGQVVGHKDLAIAHLSMANAALAFVTGGLVDFTGRPGPLRLDAISAMVRCQFLKTLTDGGFSGLPAPKVKTRASGGDYPTLAVQAFHRQFREHSEYLFGAIPPPWVGGGPESSEKASAESVVGAAQLEPPKERNPLQQAFQMARYNVTRAEQRITVLHLLTATVRGHSASLPGVGQTEFDAAQAHFWSARGQHISRMLAMGTLIGGEAADQCKAFVKEMYREGVSIMEMLEVDAVHPGQYLAVAEKKFRKALDKA